MIRVTNCFKSFPQNIVLKGVSFEVPVKSIYGFVGINGAGKSTLIKCILKFLKPEKGEICFDGKPIDHYYQFHKQIGYLSEVFQPPADLKCAEFLNYCYLLIKNKNCPLSDIQKTLSQVGLKEAENCLIRKLSKGMRQRLGIAQALVHNPPLLILDEPFSGLDPIGRYELKEYLRAVSNEGKTIFFSSHNLSEIQDLCTHAAVLHKGVILFHGKIQDLLTRYNTDNFERAFLSTIQAS